VLVDGAPVLFIDKGGKSLLTFPAASEDRILLPALLALGTLRTIEKKRLIRVERVDGDGVRRSELKEPMLRAGFVEDHRGMRLDLR
jgi:ATP-dependent Lhr-like helicase